MMTAINQNGKPESWCTESRAFILLLLIVLFSCASLLYLSSVPTQTRSRRHVSPRQTSGMGKLSVQWSNGEGVEGGGNRETSSSISSSASASLSCERDRTIEDSPPYNTTRRRIRIAIGGATTTAKLNINSTDMSKILPEFTSLLPSFCKTATVGYHYGFFLAYDKSDPLYQYPDKVDMFYGHVKRIIATKCPPGLVVEFKLIWTPYERVPGYCHEAGMMEAYLQGYDYFYRINDDTILRTPDWSDVFIDTLAGFYPRNVGVVGPTHLGDYNPTVLTYDFTHRTHMEIFGIYYPRIYLDWWADNWITRIYEPDQSIQHPAVRIVHTRQFGMRYKVVEGLGDTVQERITRDKAIIHRYIEYKTTPQPERDPGKVIAFPLFGADNNHTYGAIRNAQVAPVFFPGWSVRFYVPHPVTSPGNMIVPRNILRKLKELGTEIKEVHLSYLNINPKLLANLVADDGDVTEFLVRNSDEHLTDRQFGAVKDWQDARATFHCIRDHARHAPMAVGLYGGRQSSFSRHLGIPMTKLLQLIHARATDILRSDYGINIGDTDTDASTSASSLLANVLWERMKDVALCHDSICPGRYKNSVPFPWDDSTETFEGMKIDAYMVRAEEMKKYPPEPCT